MRNQGERTILTSLFCVSVCTVPRARAIELKDTGTAHRKHTAQLERLAQEHSHKTEWEQLVAVLVRSESGRGLCNSRAPCKWQQRNQRR
jgi:hypothetical protein